jgi:hypothetical protein
MVAGESSSLRAILIIIGKIVGKVEGFFGSCGRWHRRSLEVRKIEAWQLWTWAGSPKRRSGRKSNQTPPPQPWDS